MGLPRDQVFESDTLRELFDGVKSTRNGLNQKQLLKALKIRRSNQQLIKNALDSVHHVTQHQRYSFYKRNPNLLCTNAGLLMMREKSTMETIKQLGEAGKLSLLQTAQSPEKDMTRRQIVRRQTIIASMQHNMRTLEF